MKTIKPFPRQACLRPLLLLCLLWSAMAVHAATYYFQGNGTSAATRNWSVIANWSPNPSGGGSTVLPNFTTGFGDDVVFGNYHATENVLQAKNSPGTFRVNSITTTCNGWNLIDNVATDMIILGPGGVINNPDNVQGAPTGGGGASGNKLYTYIQLAANVTIVNYDTNYSLAIRENSTQYAAVPPRYVGLTNAGFTLTLDGPGAISFPAPAGNHAGGIIAGPGGVIKNGSGTTTFSSTNIYTGPTMVNTGRLNTLTVQKGGSAFTVADGATLGVTVNSVGDTLKIPSLSLTNSAVPLNTNLVLALGSLGNPTAPVVYATNLNLNGTVNLQVTGSGLSEGTIPLIQYDGVITGGGTLVALLLPTGVAATLINNLAVKQWQLVITEVPSLLFKGQNASATVQGWWDINLSTNWYDITASQYSVFANGLPVRFDDTAATTTVGISNSVAPYSITVSNTGTYTFVNNGAGSNQISGIARIIKDGSGTLVLGTSNTYNSFTYVKNGLLQLAARQAIGLSSIVTNDATLDLAGFDQNFTALYGNGLVTNSTATPMNLILTANGGDSGNFTGQINEGSGAITLHKQTGRLTLSGNNNYSGGTIYEAGGAAASRWITLAGTHVLGSGAVTIQAGGTLTADTSPRALANNISVEASFTLGNAGAGLLTCSGPIAFSTGLPTDVSTLTVASDVVFSGSVGSGGSSGWANKAGPGTLRLKASTCSLVQNASDFSINDGSCIIDNEAMSVIGALGPLVRVQSQVTNGTASLFVTNNGSLTVGNVNGYYRLRLGDTSSPTNSLGQQCTTNIIDIQGTLTASGVTLGYSGSTITTNNPGPSETYTTNWNGGGAYARLNLQPGSQATLNQVSASPTKTITEVYLDGATVNVPDNPSSSFLQGLTNVFIMSGGVTLNGANTNSIHIRQNLLNGGGGGGLTWNGTNAAVAQATMLQLDGASTYTGTTAINVGNLGGIGTLAGPLVLASGTTLSPAGNASTSGGSLGTFTVNHDVTLSSGAHAAFELNTTNSLAILDEFGNPTNYVRLLTTNDMLVVSGTLNVGGATLTVVNAGTNLVLGDSFKLFSKAAVGFSSVTLPALDPGLAWANNLAVDGSIRVVVPSVTPPSFLPGAVTRLPDGNVSLTATGALGATYTLWASTNAAAAPVSTTWSNLGSGTITLSPLTINDLDATNYPRRFYLFSTP